MTDIKHLRDNQGLYQKGFATKQVKVDITQILKLDKEYRELLQKVEEFRAEKNTVSKLIPKLTGKGRQDKIDEMKVLGDKLNKVEEVLNKLFVQLEKITNQIPNLPHESVPEGKDDTENQVIKTVGEIPKFNFQPKDHLELGELLDLIDTETGAKTSGARFYYLKNELVQLYNANSSWTNSFLLS